MNMSLVRQLLLYVGLVSAIDVGALELETLHYQFMQTDPDVLRADLAVSSAEARVDLSRAELLPEISTVLTTSETRREQFSTLDKYQGEDYSLILQQQVFDRPLWLEVERQTNLAQSQSAVRRDVIQQRRLSLISAYLEWLEAMQRATLLEARLTSVEKRLVQVEALFARQQISVTQMLSVKNERERVRAERSQSRSQLTRARATLQSLVGDQVELPQAIAALDVKRWPIPAVLAQRVGQLPSTHSVIQRAKSERAAAQIGLNQVESQWMPRLNARIQARQTNIGASDAETFPVETSSIELTMTWDLFDSGRRSAREREAAMAAQDADLALLAAEREVMRRQKAVNDDLNRYRESWQAALDEYVSAQEFVRSADRSFELGVGTVSDSLRALERSIDSEIRLTSRWLEALFGVAEMAQVNEQLDDALISELSTLIAQSGS